MSCHVMFLCSTSLCFHVFLLAVRAPPWERTCECAIKRMITFCRNTRVCSHLFGCFCDLSNTGVLLYLILMYSTYCSSGVGPTGFLIAVFQRSDVLTVCSWCNISMRVWLHSVQHQQAHVFSGCALTLTLHTAALSWLKE